MHTHYDNLKVSRDAPPEVIRAAYRTLSLKYHPDRNPDQQTAHRVMSLLNAAYEVLSDPARRAEHDAWIAAQERKEAAQATRQAQGRRAAAQDPHANPAARPQGRSQAGASAAAASAAEARRKAAQARAEQVRRAEDAGRQAGDRDAANASQTGTAKGASRKFVYLLYLLVGIALVSSLSECAGTARNQGQPTATAPPLPGEVLNPPMSAAPIASAPGQALVPVPMPVPAAREQGYVRPSATPLGHPWPDRSGYLSGYPVLRANGLSSLTVNNSGNASDVFLKLVSLGAGGALPVRFSLIRRGTSFKMENIAPGTYDVRYRSLDTGAISRSERFVLQEIRQPDGISYGDVRLTLYTVQGGNTKTVPISEQEF